MKIIRYANSVNRFGHFETSTVHKAYGCNDTGHSISVALSGAY